PQTELRPGPEIAALRTREARCASLALGLSEPLFMEFGDGTLGNRRQPGQDIPAKLSQSVAALLASYQPDVILTWGPEGGYGHPDHRMVSAVVTELVQQSVPGTPRTLVYPGMPNGTIPDVPEAKTIGWITSDPALLLVKVAYSQQDLEATKNAFLCHASQYPAPLLETAPLLFDSAIWRGTVHLRGAFERMEGDDLFALDRAK
ncbi:MAG: PIG-L family deacetylase, partial [Sphingorhabdus sp.]